MVREVRERQRVVPLDPERSGARLRPQTRVQLGRQLRVQEPAHAGALPRFLFFVGGARRFDAGRFAAKATRGLLPRLHPGLKTRIKGHHAVGGSGYNHAVWHNTARNKPGNCVLPNRFAALMTGQMNIW